MILRKYAVSNNELAVRMGTTAQNLSQMLSKDDVKTGTIEKISECTGIPITTFYGIEAPTTASGGDHSTNIGGNVYQVNEGKLLEELTAQRRLTEAAMDQNSRLIAIIENMSGKERN